MRKRQDDSNVMELDRPSIPIKTIAYAIEMHRDGLYHLVQYTIENGQVIKVVKNEGDVREIQVAKASVLLEGFANVNFP